MATRTEKNLSCPVCYQIFKDPVILACSHSLCKACWQQWKTERETLCCPVCRHNSLSYNPPINLALKNLCEDFLLERTEGLAKGSADLCSLHAEKQKLFCQDDQQPVCVICLHSNSHKNHRVEPIDEAASDCRAVLQYLLRPSQDRLELFNDVKRNFDQTAQDIELQAQDTERQIKDTFLILQKFLQEEEQERIDAVMKEKRQKIQRIKRESTALSREITDLSDRIRVTEDFLKAEDLSFLQNYKTTAEGVQSLPNVPHPISGLIDMDKHLNNLSYKILDSMKEKVTSILN
ncbi:Tripartite motif-containing protein 35 [Nibea albiflora]|uniref:Tripartite motif-containing protein 35 n=1 Tax=Nibea albiflora TaxID=240163 RepID=A0ACB7FGT7_NIBAL|nr:Tripartite motif-containing protein 35 [Nibea albiflora]